MAFQSRWLLLCAVVLFFFSRRVSAFGAGNIPSIAQVEGHNWRHGDIEDILETLAFIYGKKWTSMLIKRVYFGNWLRDYSQAVDVGSLKAANAATIRILVWVLSFMSFGYATAEFEVTEERLGVYRPEEHIDNPLGYADGLDARTLDPRLRGPVDPVETQIDPRTGMKNYIANEQGHWATSAGYLRYSFGRCIHYGRQYLHGSRGGKGREEDLCEALRCLGQALHTMEDFSAHSNYCELALREMGMHEVYPHCGTATEINLPNGKRVFPLVTGTFGVVDFVHSVIGEATDHFTQSEVDQMNAALQNAEGITQNITGSRGLFGSGDSGTPEFISLLGKVPGLGDGFASEARALSAASAAKEQENARADAQNPNQVPGMRPSFDPVETVRKIYPILEFRDRIVRSIHAAISNVPGLEKLLDKIGETMTAFIMGLLAPFVRPIIRELSKSLKDGSSTVVNASANSQLETWTNLHCSDPTHSMLSKDHFTNILNACAGRVAAAVVKYVVPRILYAWEKPGVPVDEVVNDVLRALHHPAMRDDRVQIHREMFDTVRQWRQETQKKHNIGRMLSSESVRTGHNHILTGHKFKGGHDHGHSHGPSSRGLDDSDGGHGKCSNGLWGQVDTRDRSRGNTSPWQPAPSHYRPPSSSGPFDGPAPPPQQDFGYGGGGGHSLYAPPPQQPPYGGYMAPPGPPPPANPSPGGWGYQSGPEWSAPPPVGAYAPPPFPPQDTWATQHLQGGSGGPHHGGPPHGPPPHHGHHQPPGWNQYPGGGYH